MKDKKLPTGITIRNNSIQIAFTLDGKQCRHSLRLAPTDANIKYASRKRGSINHDIETNNFDYEKHFPNSKSSKSIKKGAPKTVKDALLLFLGEIELTSEHTTFDVYKRCVNKTLIIEFGHLLLNELTEHHINSWIKTLSCSVKTVNNNLIPMRNIFAKATEKNG